MGNQKVAIIGAGPAGCMLARLLYRGGVNVTVFEGEASPNFRTQGGTLDLHAKTGIAAMKQAGLFDEFKKYARYDGQYLAMLDKNLHCELEMASDEKSKTVGDRPEIDRMDLRRILYESLPEDMVRWGHRLSKIEDRTLIFKDGTSASGFDLVVGADGAWSKVRHHIAPDLKPEFTGVGYHDITIPNARETAPELYALVHGGMVFIGSEGKRISIQQLGDGSLNSYANVVRRDEDWMRADKCGHDGDDLEQVRKALDEEFADWAPKVKELFRVCTKATPRSLYVLPVGARWTYTTGFTLVGDAAHLMSPYAGEGVNQALGDSMILAQAILAATGAGKDINDGVAKFEDTMMARVKPVQQLSLDLLNDWLFTPGSPKSIMPTIISRHLNHTLPTVLRPLSTAGVYSYFFVKNMLGK